MIETMVQLMVKVGQSYIKNNIKSPGAGGSHIYMDRCIMNLTLGLAKRYF